MSQVNCPFCDPNRILPDWVLYSDEDIVAMHRPNMNIPGYTIIHTVRHVTSFAELTDAEVNKIFSVAKKVTKTLLDNGVPRVYQCSFGEMVNHFHLHIFPRHTEMADIEEVLVNGNVDGAKLFSIAQKSFRVSGPEELLQNPQVAPMLRALKDACTER